MQCLYGSCDGIFAISICASTNCVNRTRSEPPHKHAQPPEQGLLVAAQQAIAPLDCASQGALPGGEASRHSPQQLEATGQRSTHLSRGQPVGARSSKLN